jgi:hypothetical protein
LDQDLKIKLVFLNTCEVTIKREKIGDRVSKRQFLPTRRA